MLLKIILFSLSAIVIVKLLIKNLSDWGIKLQKYMKREAIKTFGYGFGWERPFALLLSKVMIAFLGLMIIVVIFTFLFGTIYTG